MMAEMNAPDVYGENSNTSNSFNSYQNKNPETSDRSCQKESSIPVQSEIKTDYLENLLDSRDDASAKKSYKEKIVPHLQDDDLPNFPSLTCNRSLSDVPSIGNKTNDDSSDKIQNTESSIISPSATMNIYTSLDEENKAVGIPMSSPNFRGPVKETSIQSSSNTGNVFNESRQNNLERRNDSLQLICDYDSDSDDDDDAQGVALSNNNLSSEDNEKDVMDYRTSQVFFSEDSEEDSDSSDDKSDSDSSSTTSSSSSSSSSSSAGPDNATVIRRNVGNNVQNNGTKSKNNSVMTRGEIAIEDLPPIEDLCISVPEEECVELGKITNIVDQLVVVQANKNTPPLDLDSVLFLDHGKRALGQVFDVFGQVTEPLYCIRFNSRDHIKEKAIEKDMTVYCAPKTPHTSYVFMPHLLSAKGSDASWEDNNEPPAKCLDYSDDEEEKRARRMFKSNDKKSTDEDPEHPMKKKIRGSSFERRMNERNLRMTALHANQPLTPTIRNTASHNSNNNGAPRPPFDSSAWWSGSLPPTHTFHRSNQLPPSPCNPSSQGIIHPPTFTLPPPRRFEVPSYPVFSSPPPPAFPCPRGSTAGGPPMSPIFPFQSPPFSPFNHAFPPPIPPFDPNRPPPTFGFSPTFPPQMPRHRPPP